MLEIDVPGWALRQDGRLRSDYRKAQDPRIIISATTNHGDIRIPCDTFESYGDNLYAIALTLEKLRAIDRYGVTLHGEQYQGFTAIPASTSMTTKTEAAWDVLAREAAGEPGSAIRSVNRVRSTLDKYFREASMMAHPDRGGTDERMAAVNRARDIILIDLGEK